MRRTLGMDAPNKKRFQKPQSARSNTPSRSGCASAVVKQGDSPGDWKAPSGMADDARQWAREFVHEINQPLAALVTSAQACRRLHKANKQGAADFGQALDRMLFLAERVSTLVAQMRDRAMNAGSSAVPTDMHAVLRHALRTLEDRIRSEKVKVEIHFAKDNPPVRGDEVRLGQVALNLLRNALDAMRQNKPNQRRLTLTTQREADQFEVLLRDTGSGISIDLIERLFEPVPSAKPEGMGIGLAISREIIHGLGGSMSAQSHPEQGSVFRFSVPIWEKKEKNA